MTETATTMMMTEIEETNKNSSFLDTFVLSLACELVGATAVHEKIQEKLQACRTQIQQPAQETSSLCWRSELMVPQQELGDYIALGSGQRLSSSSEAIKEPPPLFIEATFLFHTKMPAASAELASAPSSVATINTLSSSSSTFSRRANIEVQFGLFQLKSPTCLYVKAAPLSFDQLRAHVVDAAIEWDSTDPTELAKMTAKALQDKVVPARAAIVSTATRTSASMITPAATKGKALELDLYYSALCGNSKLHLLVEQDTTQLDAMMLPLLVSALTNQSRSSSKSKDDDATVLSNTSSSQSSSTSIRHVLDRYESWNDSIRRVEEFNTEMQNLADRSIDNDNASTAMQETESQLRFSLSQSNYCSMSSQSSLSLSQLNVSSSSQSTLMSAPIKKRPLFSSNAKIVIARKKKKKKGKCNPYGSS